MSGTASMAGLAARSPSAGDWLVVESLAPDTTDATTAPFYAATAQGRVALPFCAACGATLELEQCACDVCGGDAEWREVERHGRVHAVTRVHRREPGLIVAAQPYLVIDVELDSGHRLTMTTTGPCADMPEIGQAVQIGFRDVGGVGIPAVQPDDIPGRNDTSGRLTIDERAGEAGP